MSVLYLKDDDAVLDFSFRWTDWVAEGETIVSFKITVPTGITLGVGAQAAYESGGAITYWLTGGTIGRTYAIACRVTTSAGRIDERTMLVKVIER